MSDTPRTDRLVIRKDRCYQLEITYADFARQLERELAEVKKQRDALVEALDNCLAGYDVPSEITVMTQEDYAFAKSALSAVKGGSK